MEKSYLYSYVLKLLELKTMELKLEISSLSIVDLATYYLEVILHKRQATSLQQATYDIFNIKPNIVIEYINNKLITDKTISLDDFKEMFEKK
ncbi:hypothetical protein [Spiroplasma endosymbiont of Eupeodes luniger]|uniref:hypothetical protein n=1 Tax=Spiroplasma endosymbiont of Eupeodes luniger TaxID=3066300 RepID=UPI0030CE63B0